MLRHRRPKNCVSISCFTIALFSFCLCMRRGEEYITFDQAVDILKTELKYPEDRALHFVKRFDRNNDGRLSAVEFELFKKKVEEA